MSPSDLRSRKTVIPSNIYTAFLAVSLGVIAATALFVTFKCFTQYEALFTIP